MVGKKKQSSQFEFQVMQLFSLLLSTNFISRMKPYY